ncbi:MAG: alpha/beta hydrolase [Erysipelotrichaceae bacterium]|nr:alpha/beta hydrolase [Erysipelotrichaceae bacterium]
MRGGVERRSVVGVSRIEEGWYFDGPGEGTAMIFYPGGLVEAEAYAPLMMDLADGGMDCFLIQQPFHLAFLGIDRAQKVIDDYKDSYSSWYMGGHSLGGVGASFFASSHLDELDGIALLASYSTVPLHKEGFKAVTIYGSNDHILDLQQLQDNLKNLPKDSEVIEIPGGNHCQFGDYGFQKGDGKASISAAEQQKTASDDILKAFQISLKQNQ